MLSTDILEYLIISGRLKGSLIMDKSGKGELSRYVRRVMKEKRLKQREIERRSGGKITDGYVADILCGRAKNPSVEKITALAQGLGVDPYELFAVACDSADPARYERHAVVLPDITSFLEIMEEVAEKPDMIKIIEEALRLTSEERRIIIQSLESLNEHKEKPKHSNQTPPRRKEKA